MRYAETHKAETRRKVLKAASAAIRARGPDAVGVAEVMSRAGLTHGGFYAHFDSKEALVAAAVEHAFNQAGERFATLTADLAPAAALAAFVDSYVTLEHRNQPERGCPLATLSSDLPRQGARVRRAYEQGVRGLVARIANWLPAVEGDRIGLATSLVAEMAGTVALSRSFADDAEAARMLAHARRRLKARMGLSSEGARP